MKHSRRRFLQTASAVGAAATLGKVGLAPAYSNADLGIRRFQFVQIDVFTSRRLEGNPPAVFLDARGLSDEEMQDLARETNLQETTFVFPRDAATEREQGVKVRIFVPNEEIPFAGHPTLGTAMVLRCLSRRIQRRRTCRTEQDQLRRQIQPDSFALSRSAQALTQSLAVEEFFTASPL